MTVRSEMRAVWVFAFFLFAGGLAAPGWAQITDHREVAARVVRDELHQQLEKVLGADVSVETYVQALDHLAHGEFEEARAIAAEQGVAELLGATLGSGAASLIGAAWSFDKWVWSSCQEWGKTQDRKAFLAGFLKPKIEQWTRERKIPDWRLVRGDPTNPTAVPGSVEAWFDDYRMTLRRIALFADREAEIDRLKQEMWEQTRWVMGKLHQQFERERQLREAARRAGEEIRRRVEEKAALAREAEEALRAAGLKPTEEALKRYLVDPAYREEIAARGRPGSAGRTAAAGRAPGEEPEGRERGAGPPVFGLWIVERRWPGSDQREEAQWVVYREGSQEVIWDMKPSYHCFGELEGWTLTCRWPHDIGEFTTVLRFDPGGRSFTGETNILYYATGERVREILKGRRPPSSGSATSSPPAETKPAPTSLLANGDFSGGLTGWQANQAGYGGSGAGVRTTGPEVKDGRLVLGASAGSHSVWQEVPVNGLDLRLRGRFRVLRWSTFGGRNGGWAAVSVGFLGRNGSPLGRAYFYLNPVAPSASRPGVLWERLGAAEPVPTGWNRVDVDIREVAVKRLGIAEADVGALRIAAVVFGTHEDGTFTRAEFDGLSLEPAGGAGPAPAAGGLPAARSLAGMWEGTEGTLRIKRVGDGRFEGDYTVDEGRVFFVLQGREVTGYWVEAGSAKRCDEPRDGSHHWGKVKLELSPDGNTMEGRWTYCASEEPSGAWTWRRTGSASLPGSALLFADDFERADLGPSWAVASGSWRIVGGKLEGAGRDGLLWLARPFPRDIAVEVEASGAYDLNVGLAGDGGVKRGYTFDFGGWWNTKTALVEGDRIVAEATDSKIENSERAYRLRIERRGGVITCWIDGRRVLRYNEARTSDPARFDRVYLQNWGAPIRYDNLRVYRLGP